MTSNNKVPGLMPLHKYGLVFNQCSQSL